MGSDLPDQVAGQLRTMVSKLRADGGEISDTRNYQRKVAGWS